jgi:hypothetical protein
MIYDDAVESSISALRFMLRPLQRTLCTPRGTAYARLDLEALNGVVESRIAHFKLTPRGSHEQGDSH